jgi:hypothetical protein
MKTLQRRHFLQSAGAGLLLVNFQFSELAHAATNAPAPAKSTAKDVLDTWLSIDASNQVTVYVGKVDLGTGTKTALSQIAAEELSIPFDILSDFNKEVSRTYGALFENLMGLKGVGKRAAFVIDASGKVVYAKVNEEAGQQVDFAAIQKAVESC